MRSLFRTFIAIDICNEQMREDIYHLREKLNSKHIKFIDLENIHITIKFLGYIEETDINQICDVLSLISFRRFDITISNIRYLPNSIKPRVICLDVIKGEDELNGLYQMISYSLEQKGFKKESRRFLPHVTIARFRTLNNLKRLRVKSIDRDELNEYRIHVNEIQFKKSILDVLGAKYENIFTKSLM